MKSQVGNGEDASCWLDFIVAKELLGGGGNQQSYPAVNCVIYNTDWCLRYSHEYNGDTYVM